MVSGGGKRIKDRGGVNAHGTGTASFPPSRLLVWHSSFDHARSRHASLVRGHALAQQLEIVLPTKQATELAASLQWETSFFYEVTAPLAHLISPRFVEEYVANGALYMIAKNVASDSHNTAMILPSGELLLLVDNETYEQLGLVGHKYAEQIPAAAQCAAPHRSSTASRRGQRYVIRIDLTSRAFASPEPNSYRDRVLHCLSTKFQPLTMLVAAYNDRGSPRTILFDDNDTIERTRIEINGVHEQLHEIFVPALCRFLTEKNVQPPKEEKLKMEMTVLRGSLEGVYDWLGAVACRLTDVLQQHTPLEAYVSTFDGIPEGIPMELISDVSVVKWRGLMGAAFTQRVLDRTREAVASGTIPWAAITVWGFADAIVSWRQEYKATLSRAQEIKLRKLYGVDPPPPVATETANREHGFLLSGTNNYTFLVLPNHEYFVLQELGPHDATM